MSALSSARYSHGLMSVTTEDVTVTGHEAGTPPGDRRLRPDVQGLRAIAILLAIVYHADIQPFSGGYVGIEVFFVISGFVITGLLLREHETTGRTSLRSFYGRRVRRILPMATLVIIVTIIASYVFIGASVGGQTAIDGRWAALFLANFHYAATDTNYLVAQSPPSPLLNYWSLGVEEQFYIVYPALFLFLGWWAQRARRGSFRLRITVVLVAVIVASYTYSIVFTASNAQSAYFSLLVRSWELALGGLIAVYSPELRRIPQAWAAVASWVGLAVILVASVTLTPASDYPGALVAIPTLRGRSRDCRRCVRSEVGGRGPSSPPAVSLPRPHLLLALPVALADPRDRRAAPGGGDAAGVGRRLVVGGRRGTGVTDLSVH